MVHHAKLGLATKRNSCLASYVLSHCPTGVTLLTLLLIAIERFVAVHCPFLYHRVFTKWNTGIMATSIWIYTWILLPVLWFSTNHWHSGMKECNFADLSSEIYIAIVCGHLLTVFLIAAALQGTIAYTAWKHRCKIRIQARLVNVHTRVQQDAKIARMLAVVSGIFYFCWVPCLFALPFKLWNPGGTSSFWFYVWEQIGGVILESNSFMNPIIYACYDKELRQCFRNVLFRRSDYPYQSVRSERRQNTQDEHLKTTKLWICRELAEPVFVVGLLLSNALKITYLKHYPPSQFPWNP